MEQTRATSWQGKILRVSTVVMKLLADFLEVSSSLDNFKTHISLKIKARMEVKLKIKHLASS